MTIDQRLKFLLQSTNSLHATTALHGEQIEKLTKKIDAIASLISDSSLAVLDRERLLGKLDGA